MIYKDKFYRNQTRKNAEVIVPIILKYVTPMSVLDVGCGVGHWLDVFKCAGVNNVYGIDSLDVPKEELVISKDNFIVRNLEGGLSLQENLHYDLIICLEVAEHLSEEVGKKLVEELTKHSSIIIFSSAIPNQGGVYHVNEQWQSYWVKLFEMFGYCKIDFLRNKLWNKDIEFCYKQNMFVFVKINHLEYYPKLKEEYINSKNTPENIVHPNLYCHEDLRSVPLKRALGIILFLPIIIKKTLWSKNE